MHTMHAFAKIIEDGCASLIGFGDTAVTNSVLRNMRKSKL